MPKPISIFLIITFLVIYCNIFTTLSYAQQNHVTTDGLSHGLSLTNNLKYSPNFTKLEYTSSQAKKGGHLNWGAIGSFNSLNPFILQGTSADGLYLTYDTLLARTSDEIASYYGLLAKNIEIAKDNQSVIFNLRKIAKWHDGSSITAKDIIFSFAILKKEAHPIYKIYLKEIKNIVAITPHKVKFIYNSPLDKNIIKTIGNMPVLSQQYYKNIQFNKISLIPFLGSGPYMVDTTYDINNRSITYKRVENYWGKDLAINKYRYNFDSITYKYYTDHIVATRAFKAGEFDVREENISKIWHKGYNIEKVRNNIIIKEEINHNIPLPTQGFIFNLRKQKFQNLKIRKAISFAFDFEWTNKNLFFNSYNRTQSYFTNSQFTYKLPLVFKKEKAAQEIMNDMKKQNIMLNDNLLQEKFASPITNGNGNNRKQLLHAARLLKEAGWFIDKKTMQLTSQTTKEIFTIEFLISSPSFYKVILPYIKNLKKLGISAHIRKVDSNQYQKLIESFKFDMTVMVFSNNLIPGKEQYTRWHSKYINHKGSQNYIGTNNKALDYLVTKITETDNIEYLAPYITLLDNILLNNYYMVLQWNINKFRILYYNKFNYPKIRPKYGLSIIDSWWSKEI